MSRESYQLASDEFAAATVYARSLNVLAYRSVATYAPTEIDVQRLLRAAQARNKAEGLTGVLIYHRGEFFQWLEGPPDALGRVWNSILHDPRHHQVTVLRDEPIATRVFDGWDLRIATGGRASVEAAVAALESSQLVLKAVIEKPTSLIDRSWEDIFSTIVIPRLREVHGRDVSPGSRYASTPVIWHADVESGGILARTLIAPDGHLTTDYIDGLLDQGATVEALYQEVFEPAQLHLGHMVDDDRCNDFQLAIGLARMQIELMRVNAIVPADHMCRPGMRVLLSSQPEESHRVGLLMSAEVFGRKGWDVTCPPPGDDQSLGDLVHSEWFDVLKLSQSGSLRRDRRLAAMRDTIDSTRAASLNRALIVLVDGRTFVERPQAHKAIHANAMSRTVLDAVPLAERLLALSHAVNPVPQVTST